MTTTYTPCEAIAYSQTDDDLDAQAALDALASLPEEEALRHIDEAFEREGEE